MKTLEPTKTPKPRLRDALKGYLYLGMLELLLFAIGEYDGY